MQLSIYDHIPSHVLAQPATKLHRYLDGPSLFQLAGERQRPVFVSVLQHGNEVSGWEAIRHLVAEQGNRLQRTLWVFVANIEAARYGKRRLDHQPDYNRCWPGGEAAASRVHRLLAELTHRVRTANPLLSLDIHNNSGRNPHYAATTRMEPRWLHLCRQFSNQAVYFGLPTGVQCEAFSRFCPAITLECGQSGGGDATVEAQRLIEYCLTLDDVPSDTPNDLQLYQTIARLTLGPEVSFGIGEACNDDLCLVEELESLNFVDLDAGVALAHLRNLSTPRPLSVISDQGQDVTEQFLRYEGSEIQLGRSLTPSMLTLDPTIARQDCLGYLMKKIQPWTDQRLADPAHN